MSAAKDRVASGPAKVRLCHFAVLDLRNISDLKRNWHDL